MESMRVLNTTNRATQLEQWLSTLPGLPAVVLQPMANDASLRRYFRIAAAQTSWVVMDAPPPAEDCRPYVAIANALRQMGLQTPEIIAADLAQGFLLITDFGDLTYLRALASPNADALYTRALQALVTLQHCQTVPGRVIPPFTAEWMQQEWRWHQEWFLNQYLGLKSVPAPVEAAFTRLVDSAVTQPQVFMHRDYHSANLMVLPQDGVGILDFQDAFIGPMTYDLASLLRDCYIDWPAEQVKTWVTTYWQLCQADSYLRDLLQGASLADLMRWFDWMGVERHLKALFTFARKHIRDHQSQYLQHIPRTLHYMMSVTQAYPELHALHDYYRDTVLPAFRKRQSCAP